MLNEQRSKEHCRMIRQKCRGNTYLEKLFFWMESELQERCGLGFSANPKPQRYIGLLKFGSLFAEVDIQSSKGQIKIGVMADLHGYPRSRDVAIVGFPEWHPSIVHGIAFSTMTPAAINSLVHCYEQAQQ